MAEPFFKAHIADHDYELPKLTLGDTRILKAEFGVESLGDFNETDPDHICGLLYLSLLREGVSADEALARVEDIDVRDFYADDTAQAEDAGDDDDVELSPTSAGPETASASAKPKAGKPATRRKTPGTQR